MMNTSSFTRMQRVCLIILAILFTGGASVLAVANARAPNLAPRFHWPDETSSAYFAARIARGESFVVPEPRNAAVGNLIHPRTMNVRADGALVPGAYLGMSWWYGMVGRVVGVTAMGFLTPLLMAIALLAVARMMRMLAGRAAAIGAVVLLATHPSVWMFTATTWLPNAPFVALLLLGFSCAFGARTWWRWGVAGVAIGIALTMRTHELLWVLAGISAISWRELRGLSRRTIGLQLAAHGFGLALPFIPILVLQTQLYGSPFTTGYAILQAGGATPTEFVLSWLPGWLAALVAPFGWHPIAALRTAWAYLIVPFPWLWALAIVGMASVRPRHSTSAIVGTIALVAWLLLYYGSWILADPLVRATNVLTISYVRYWLPMIVIIAGWAGVGIAALAQRVPEQWRWGIVAIGMFALLRTATGQTVRDPIEGLMRQRQALREHHTRAHAVIAATPRDAVIVSHRMDKVFFPERAVVYAAGDATADAEFLEKIRKLVDRVPVYWYAPGEHVIPGLLQSVAGGALGETLYRVQ